MSTPAGEPMPTAVTHRGLMGVSTTMSDALDGDTDCSDGKLVFPEFLNPFHWAAPGMQHGTQTLMTGRHP